jgi:hypothetical protein
MWEPRCLTTLQVSKACYRDNFAFLFLLRLRIYERYNKGVKEINENKPPTQIIMLRTRKKRILIRRSNKFIPIGTTRLNPEQLYKPKTLRAAGDTYRQRYVNNITKCNNGGEEQDEVNDPRNPRGQMKKIKGLSYNKKRVRPNETTKVRRKSLYSYSGYL